MASAVALRHTSTLRLFGLPLYDIAADRAVGIVAIGRIATGVVAIGVVARGILAVGVVSLGLLSVGVVALGGIAVGAVAAGGDAVGAVAVDLTGEKVAVGSPIPAQSVAWGPIIRRSGVPSEKNA